MPSAFREGVHINQELLQIPPSVTEQFIELLCQFSPDQVIETLQVLECYRLEETIQVRPAVRMHKTSVRFPAGSPLPRWAQRPRCAVLAEAGKY